MVSVSRSGGQALGSPDGAPQPNTALHLTAFSLRSSLAAAFGGR
jgi:hypothetical protein